MGTTDLVASAIPFLGPVRLVSSADIRFDYRAWNDEAILAALRAAGWTGGPIGYFSSYREKYTRTETLLAILRRNGIKVEEHLFPRRPLALLRAVWKLSHRYPVLVLGFRSHGILPLVRLLVGKRSRIVFDAFVSLYDTLCEDRRLLSPDSLLGKRIKAYDTWLCNLAGAVLVDTKAHAEYFRTTLRSANVFPMYVECNDALFTQTTISQSSNIILWYGTCVPLHGVERILQWAKSLESISSVRFRLIGPVAQYYKKLIGELRLSNVEYVPWVDYERLPQEIASASLCLGGPFGTSDKAQRVIAGKTYQMLACGANVLVSDTPGNRELFGPVPITT